MSLYEYTGETSLYLTKGGEYDIDSAGDYHTTIDDKGDEHELSTDFILDYFKPKAEAKPIYTSAMADNGELPSVGMEVRYTPIENDSNTTLEAGQYVYGKIIAYHDGFVWTSDNGLRKLSNTKFKPTLSPIELINGDAYQFEYKSSRGLGFYNNRNEVFSSLNVQVPIQECINIKHLT